jgi:hypothetical protein
VRIDAARERGESFDLRAARAHDFDLRQIMPAMSNRSGPAFGPAMARAKAAISCASAGSSPAGLLRPCRSALRAERALPSGVFGPRLCRPFLRLASRRASLIILLVPVLF